MIGLIEILLVLLILGAGAVWLVNMVAASRPDSGSARDRADLERARAELAGLRELVADLKDTAYDHRELDSALATIMIDRIRTYERQQRELP
jgi:hypothetical protein